MQGSQVSPGTRLAHGLPRAGACSLPTEPPGGLEAQRSWSLKQWEESDKAAGSLGPFCRGARGWLDSPTREEGTSCVLWERVTEAISKKSLSAPTLAHPFPSSGRDSSCV